MPDKMRQAAARERFRAKMKAEGRRRVELWIRQEDVAAFQEAARTGHGMARLRREALETVLSEVRPKAATVLQRRTERAMQAQMRAESRTWPEGSNEMPPRVRFDRIPPREVRQAARYVGWRFDPVSATWWLPRDPETWTGSERVIEQAQAAGVQVDRLGVGS